MPLCEEVVFYTTCFRVLKHFRHFIPLHLRGLGHAHLTPPTMPFLP